METVVPWERIDASFPIHLQDNEMAGYRGQAAEELAVARTIPSDARMAETQYTPGRTRPPGRGPDGYGWEEDTCPSRSNATSLTRRAARTGEYFPVLTTRS